MFYLVLVYLSGWLHRHPHIMLVFPFVFLGFFVLFLPLIMFVAFMVRALCTWEARCSGDSTGRGVGKCDIGCFPLAGRVR